MKRKKHWYCEWSSTLGSLEDTAENIWGTLRYDERKNINESVVFFGMYGLPSFLKFRQHKGDKHILWCGTDILHLKNGYWIDEIGEVKVNPAPFCEYLNCFPNWVENDSEQRLLESLGIKSKICPSFLGDINKFEVSFKPGNKVYLSCSGNNFHQYGWDLVEEIAGRVPIEFYLYGSNEWKTRHKNVIIRGRIDKEVMNKEISEMQAGLRPLEFDGASEIVIKSLLQGQHTISRIQYPFVDSYKTKKELIKLLTELPSKKVANLEARSWFVDNLNLYPWNINARK